MSASVRERLARGVLSLVLKEPAMTRHVAPLACIFATLAACAHDSDHAGTTTVTSGNSPGGVRVTNVTIGDFDPADRLAGELCRREATCGRIQGTDEARLLGEQNCVTERAPSLRASMSAWSCSPATNRGLFEECLAAIRSERCETRLDSFESLPSCRRDAVCAR